MAEVSKWEETVRQLKRTMRTWFNLYKESKYGIAGTILILIFAVMAIIAPLLTSAHVLIYSPQFMAPQEDVLRSYLYPFDIKEPAKGYVIGYTQPAGMGRTGGDWLIINYGDHIEGMFLQNMKMFINQSSNTTGNLAPWEVRPYHFTLSVSDLGLSGDITDLAYVCPAAANTQFQYSGPGQDPYYDGEIAMIIGDKLVIYDMYTFKNSSYDMTIVQDLPFTPTWIVVDTESSGNLNDAIISNVSSPSIKYMPYRYIMVGNTNQIALYMLNYSYSNDPHMTSRTHTLQLVFTDTFNSQIIYKPLVFYDQQGITIANYELDFITHQLRLASINEGTNIIVVPLSDKTVIYRGFDIMKVVWEFINIVNVGYEPNVTKTDLNVVLSAPPAYSHNPLTWSNPIFLPVKNGNNAQVDVIYPKQVDPQNNTVPVAYTINVGAGDITASPSVYYANENYTVYIPKYENDVTYIYAYKRGKGDTQFTLKEAFGDNGVRKVDGKVIEMFYVSVNSQMFVMTDKYKVLQMDMAANSEFIPTRYFHWKTREMGDLPYPKGAVITSFEYMGGLSGTKYAPNLAAIDCFGIYYANNTKTFGIFQLKGDNVAPLPPGTYPSGNTYYLGTDDKGHDILTWLFYGAQVAFIVGILASVLSVTIGTLYGVISGYLGGKVDILMMRFVDVMLTLPGLPIILILTSILGPSIWNIVLVIGFLGWSGIARVIRAQTLSLKNRPFIDAARVAGASHRRIILVHLVPNVIPFSFLYMSLGVAGAIISEASLSFLGLGDPKAVSWGQMLYSIQTAGATMYAWWWLLPPGLSITALSLGFFLVGRAFDEILNPRLRKR